MNQINARSVTLNTPTDSNNTMIIEYIADNAPSLLGIIRSYVMRMGLASGEDVAAVALEVLQQVVLEALDHADRFDPTGQPMAWLLKAVRKVRPRVSACISRIAVRFAWPGV